MKAMELLELLGDAEDLLPEIGDESAAPESEKPKKCRSGAWLRWGGAAACFCLILAAVFAVPRLLKQDVVPLPSEETDPAEMTSVTEPIEPEPIETETEETEAEPPVEEVEETESSIQLEPPEIETSEENPPESAASATSVIWGEPTAAEGYTMWNGKGVTFGLLDALEAAGEEDVFAVAVRPMLDDGFVYEGRTLREYYLDKAEETNLPEKLRQLLKEGDELKYGEALYQTGTAEGLIWGEALYRERCDFYGKELLETYLVDGEFLRDQLEADLETAERAQEASEAYSAAEGACLRDIADSVSGVLPTKVSEKTGQLLMFLTRTQLAELGEEWSECWFGFADAGETWRGVEE